MRQLLAVTIGFVLVSTITVADEDGTLRVMTYNIHYGHGLDGQLDLRRIAGVIREAQPDLVALQEVDFKTRRSGRSAQASKLGELCDMNAMFGRAIDYQGGQYGNAILSRKKITATRNHRLPRAGGKENRFALACTIQLQKRKQIVFVSTHFDHQGRRAREEASKTVALLTAQSNTPIILAGDLNCEPNAPELVPLSSVFRPVNQNPLQTFPASHPARQIDYILIDQRARWRIESVKVIDDGGASDHRPILAVLRLRH